MTADEAADAEGRASKHERGSRPYGRSAIVLSLAVASTGTITYAYFALASHSLTAAEYGGITLLWSAVFITVSVLYRPVEQLLSRTIADREARGVHGREHLRVAATIQLALGAVFVVVALALRHVLQDRLFEGSGTLYWLLVVAVLAYAASYFARGFFAGHRWFGLYGSLMLLESAARFAFAFAVVVGAGAGQALIALGIGIAPLLSLAVVPWFLARRLSPAAAARTGASELPAAGGGAVAGWDEPDLNLAGGSGFAGAVLLVMLCEQTFLNAGPLMVKFTQATGGAAAAGVAFNVLLIARAPLQLFQAVQTSILPQLTRLRATGAAASFRRTVTITILAIAAAAGALALLMLAVGPFLMHAVFGAGSDYARGGLAVIALGMGLYLSAATLNQAALSQGRAREAALRWLVATLAFLGFLALPGFDDRVLQVEIGYTAGAAFLCALLYALYRRRS